MTSNTTAHVAVWEQLKGLKGDDLTAWRMNAIENRATGERAQPRYATSPFRMVHGGLFG